MGALLGDHPHARLRFAVNHGLCGVPVLFDHVRFSGETMCQVPAPSTASVTSSSVLTFDQMADWSSSVPLALDPSRRTEGSASSQFGPCQFTFEVSHNAEYPTLAFDRGGFVVSEGGP